jgi:hypothetical protein
MISTLSGLALLFLSACDVSAVVSSILRPVGQGQAVSVNYNTPKAVVLSASQITSTASFSVTSNPSHGTLSGSGTNWMYSPTPGYTGTDAFTFQVTDSQAGTSFNSTVTLNVLPAVPTLSYTAISGVVGVPLNTAVNTSLSPNGGAVTACGANGAQTTSLTGVGLSINNSSCLFTGTPTGPFSGTISVQATNVGGASNPATVLVTVVYPTPTLNPVVTPSSGTGATSITLTGTGFFPATTATVGGQTCAITSTQSLLGSTSLTCTTSGSLPLGPQDVVVTNPVGLTATITGGFTVVAATATVTSLSPTNGTTGTVITITGTNISSSATVTVGGSACTSVNVTGGGTQLTCAVPAKNPGTVATVILTNPSQSGITAGTFTYNYPTPTLTSVSPASGTAGTSITLTGTGFYPATTATVGGQACAITSTQLATGSTTLTCTTSGSLTTGGQTIVVTNPVGLTATLTNGFTVTNPTAVVTSLLPTSGVGGTIITITGTGFSSSATVTVGSGSCTSVNVTGGGTQITCAVPANTPTTVATVTVTNPSQSGVTAGTFTYNYPAPTLTSVSPTSGTAGTAITLTGTGFYPATTVTVGGLACAITSTQSSSGSTNLTCTTDSTLTAGPQDVVATNPTNQTATLSGGFTVTVSLQIYNNNCGSGPGQVVNQNWPTFATNNLPYYNGGSLSDMSQIGGDPYFTPGLMFDPSAGFVPFPTTDGTSYPLSTIKLGGGYTGNGQTIYTLPVTIGASDFTFSFEYNQVEQLSAEVGLVIADANYQRGILMYPYAASTSDWGTRIDSVCNLQALSGSAAVITNLSYSHTSFGAAGWTPFKIQRIGSVISVSINGNVATSYDFGQSFGGKLGFFWGGDSRFQFRNFSVSANYGLVTSLLPTAGSGGTVITVTGSGFSGSTSVTVGGNTCTGVSVTGGGTQLTCTVPAGLPGAASVVMSNPSASPGSFVYASPTPTLTAVSPTLTGPGTSITMTGTGFYPTTAVLAGGLPCTVTSTQSSSGSTSITCVTSSSVQSGPRDVVVTNPGGLSATLSNGITVTSMTPNSGSGGTVITVNGAGFSGSTSVSVGGNSCTGVNVTGGGTQLSCTVPAGAIGAVPVTTSNPTVNLGNFTYPYPTPTLTAITPSSGGAGTSITVTGTGFYPATTMTVGGQACAITSTVSNGSTSLTCVTSTAMSTGAANVVATNPGGVSATQSGWFLVGSESANGPLSSTASGSTLTISTANNSVQLSGSIAYSISGGTGPYVVSADQGTLSSTTGSGNFFPSAAGSAHVTVTDSLSKSATIAIPVYGSMSVHVVNSSPNYGDSTNYTITGGSGNYSVTADYGSVSNSSGSGVYTANGLSVTCNIIVNDNVTGALASTTLTVANVPVLTITVNPTEIPFNSSAAYTITNGSTNLTVYAYYDGYVDNSGGSGNYYAVYSWGTDIIYVVDNTTGQTATVNIIVDAPAAPVVTINPTEIGYGVNTAQYTVTVGSGSYYVYTNNPSTTSVSNQNGDGSYTPGTFSGTDTIYAYDYYTGLTSVGTNIIVDAPAPTNLLLTGTMVSKPTLCAGPYNVGVTATDGTPIAATANVTVTLSGVGSGHFYSDSSCTPGNEVTSRSIANGSQQSSNFFFKDPSIETLTLTAADQGSLLTSSTLSFVNISGSFVPSNMPGLVLWLDPATAGSSDGDLVGSWSNSVPTGDALTQSYSGYQPVYHTNVLNGYPAVRFDGSSQYLGGTITGLPTGSAARTWISALAAANVAQTSEIMGYGSQNSSNNRMGIWLSGDGTAQVEICGDGMSTTTSLSNNVPFVFSFAYGAGTQIGNLQISVNGTVASSSGGTSVPATNDNYMEIGRIPNYWGYYAAADVYETMIFSKTLSAADVATVECYLSHKYGLTIGHSCSQSP